MIRLTDGGKITCKMGYVSLPLGSKLLVAMREDTGDLYVEFPPETEFMANMAGFDVLKDGNTTLYPLMYLRRRDGKSWDNFETKVKRAFSA